MQVQKKEERNEQQVQQQEPTQNEPQNIDLTNNNDVINDYNDNDDDDDDDLNQPGFKSCDSVENYEFLNQIGQGVYGVVCMCHICGFYFFALLFVVFCSNFEKAYIVFCFV